MQYLSNPFSNHRDSLVESATFVLFEFAEPTIKKLVDKFKEEADEATVRRYLTDFERFKQSLQLKDPFQYKNFMDLEQAVDAAKGKSEFKKKKKPKVDTSGHEAEAIADDADVQIFKGDEQHKCVKYGNGYSFCISRAAGGNMFNSYRLSKASTFYFIFFKKVSKDDPKHIMVLDRTKDGWEWTFADNATKPTTWEKVEQSFPVLRKHQHLFVNKEMDDVESKMLNDVKDFFRNKSTIDFSTLPYETQTQIARSGSMIRDSEFPKLDKAQRNEYFSTGSNISEKQIESMTPSEESRYMKVRATVWEHLEDYIQINSLDRTTDWFTQYFLIPARRELFDLMDKSEGGDLLITDENQMSHALYELPEELSDYDVEGDFTIEYQYITSLKNMPQNIEGSITVRGCNIHNLEGMPDVVSGSVNISNNHYFTSLEGCPSRITGDFDIHECNSLKSLQHFPREVGGSVTIGAELKEIRAMIPKGPEGDYIREMFRIPGKLNVYFP